MDKQFNPYDLNDVGNIDKFMERDRQEKFDQIIHQKQTEKWIPLQDHGHVWIHWSDGSITDQKCKKKVFPTHIMPFDPEGTKPVTPVESPQPPFMKGGK